MGLRTTNAILSSAPVELLGHADAGGGNKAFRRFLFNDVMAAVERALSPIRPEDFGAVGDGISDDAPFIQAAANANPGKMIRFSGKTYRIGSNLALNTNSMRWDGEGINNTVLKCDYGVTACVVVNAPGGDIAFAKLSNMTIDRTIPASVVTLGVGTPGVVTWPNHGQVVDRPFVIATTGALLTVLVAGTVYYIKAVLDVNRFTLAATVGGAAIAFSGIQSGTHTATIPPDVEAKGVFLVDFNYALLENVYVKNHGVGVDATATVIQLGLDIVGSTISHISAVDLRVGKTAQVSVYRSRMGLNGGEPWNRIACVEALGYVDTFTFSDCQIVPQGPQANQSPAFLFNNIDPATPGPFRFNDCNIENVSSIIASNSGTTLLTELHFVGGRYAPNTAFWALNAATVLNVATFTGITCGSPFTLTAPRHLVMNGNILSPVTLIGGTGASVEMSGNELLSGNLTLSGAWTNIIVTCNQLYSGVLSDTSTGTAKLVFFNVTSAGPQVLPVTGGGTGIAAGTSGGLPYFSSTTSMLSSALLTQFGPIYGGGVGAPPVAMAAAVDGQLIVGQTANVPLWKTMSGDVTVSAGGVFTLPAVNATTGNFGTATAAPNLTVNAKGLVTFASSIVITPAVGSITGLGTGVATALAVNVGTVGSPLVNGGTAPILSAGPTGGIGYATGAGGSVTQITNKSTGVTLNTVTGSIVMNNAALAATTSVGFTLTNSAIAATDIVLVIIRAGATADSYVVTVDAVAAGSCRISLRNYTAGSLGEAVVLSFVVIKGVVS